MLTPEYLAATPDALVELYGKIEQDILANMAERIAKYDYYIPAVQHQHQRLRAMGMLETEIEQQLAALTGKTQAELKKLMAQAVDEALTSDAKIYAAAGMGDVDPLAVAGVREALQSGLRQTSGIFRNLTRTTANTAAKQFEDALDRAWLQVTSGAFDYNTAIRNAVKDLARTGVQSITYPSSHVDTIETAVRRAVVTGVNQTAAKSQLALMDELDIDLVEVTAHAGARPSHQEWQGQIYCRKGSHPKYKNFEDATGYGTGDGLCGWNCNHSFFPYVEGAPRTYSKAQLKDYSAKNITYNGQQLTEYEALQQQRYILVFDFKDYFGSAQHWTVKNELARRVHDPKTRKLANDFLENFGPAGYGLGSQISQNAALMLPNKLDHIIKEELQIKGYGRYMDDGYLIHEDIHYLEYCLERIKEVCAELGITLNLRKTKIRPITRGIVFLKTKFILTETGRVLRKMSRASMRAMKRKLFKFRKWYEAGEFSLEDIRTAYDSFKGHMRRGDSFKAVARIDLFFKHLFGFHPNDKTKWRATNVPNRKRWDYSGADRATKLCRAA